MLNERSEVFPVRQAKPLSIERLSELAKSRGSATAGISFGSIDFSRPFVPEYFTHLYYTNCYDKLSRQQRLRYNQLFGMRVNETFMMFEGAVANVVMRSLSADRQLMRFPGLRGCLLQMIEEEEQHYRMFRTLNRLGLPEVYEVTDRYFTNLRWIQSALLGLIKVLPQKLTFLVWVILFSEEWSRSFSKAMIRGRHTESLGEIEPNFVKAHVAHLVDESRHVQVDVRLIASLLETVPAWVRRADAWLVRRFLRKLVIPRRSGIAVVKHLIGEYPSLAAIERDMIRGIHGLRHEPRFLATFYGRAAVPLTYALFEAFPEFDYLRMRGAGSDPVIVAEQSAYAAKREGRPRA